MRVVGKRDDEMSERGWIDAVMMSWDEPMVIVSKT